MGFNVIEIPKANAVKFSELGPATAERYNSLPMGRDAFWLQIRDFQVKKPFAQPWQFSDKIELQYHINNSFAAELQLIDRFGRVYHTWNNSNYSVYTVLGNVVGVTTNSGVINVAVKTFHWKVSFSDINNLPTGFYWFLLKVQFDTNGDFIADTDVFYISEPQFVAQRQPKTVLVEYYHKVNKYDLIFQQTGARFAVRIPGYIADFFTDSDDTSYKDQVSKVTLLSSYPSEQYSLIVGGRTGIPAYMQNMINRIMAMSNTKIDYSGEDAGYVKDESAKWEWKDVDRYPMKWGSLKIRPAKPTDSLLTVKKMVVPLYITNASYPYFLHTVTITDGISTKTITNGKIIENIAAEVNWLNQMNGFVSMTLGLTGSFVQDDQEVYYIPGENEYYNSAVGILLSRFITFSKDNSSNNVAFNFTADYIGIECGGANSYGSGTMANFSTSKTSTLVQIDTSIRVFHNDHPTKIETSTPSITGITGDIPINLVTFNVSGTKMTVFDASILSSCVFNLVQLGFNDNQLVSIVNFGHAFTELRYIYLYENNLTTVRVDELFNAFYANATSPASVVGEFFISFQTPPAPPTSASLIARFALGTTYGWNVQTD